MPAMQRTWFVGVGGDPPGCAERQDGEGAVAKSPFNPGRLRWGPSTWASAPDGAP